MEHRKNYNTPRERVDDDMLLRILNEGDCTYCSYGGTQSVRRNTARVESGEATRQPRMMPRQENSSDGCSCNESCAKKNCLSGYHLAMSYTPDQEWQNLYSEDDAMSHGTIFTELYKPFFHGCSGSCR